MLCGQLVKGLHFSLHLQSPLPAYMMRTADLDLCGSPELARHSHHHGRRDPVGSSQSGASNVTTSCMIVMLYLSCMVAAKVLSFRCC